ncbi:MAG: translocation/assembly module TamB domain-containing protein [Arenibacterium sp.]
MRYLVFLLSFVALINQPVFAQDSDEEDGGFISNLLQDALSGENRAVQVIGLEGALSSRATIREIRISDDDGVWLTITEAELDWRRAALLRGRLSVNTLSAGQIEIVRPPLPTEPDPELPSPVATPFQVPELPVAVNIGTLSVPKLVLGEAVLGIAAELKIDGNLALEDGSLDTNLAITRLDRTGDRINLIAGFANETRQIKLDIDIEEAAGGLLADTLKIPERPAVRLSVKGDGPVSDFTADIQMDTAGRERLGGQVRLSEAEVGADGTAFAAALSGDLRPLMAEQYHAFFGDEARLDLAGQTGANGALDLQSFALVSEALDLNGSAQIAEGGQIAGFALDGAVASPTETSIQLPIGGPITEITRAEINANFDATEGNGWTLVTRLDGFSRPDIAIGTLELTGEGTLSQGAETDVIGNLDAGVQGLTFSDAALNAAVGDAITLNGGFDWSSGGVIRLSDFLLSGADYTARVSGDIDGLESGFAVRGEAEIEAADLSRFEAIAGRPLKGAVSLEAEGSGAPLTGAFDVRLTMGAQDLSVGIAQLDPLIEGASRMVLDAARDESGTTLRAFELESVALSASGAGTIANGQAELTLDARLDDLGRIVPQAPGEVTLSANVVQARDQIDAIANLNAPDGTFVDFDGTIWQDGRIDGDFKAAFNQLQKFVPALSGSLTAEGNAARDTDALWRFATETGGDAGINGRFAGQFDEASGAMQLDLDAGIDRIERLVPQLTGAITVQGKAARSEDAAWQADLSAGGTTGLSGDFSGQFDELTGATRLRLDADFEQLERFVPQLVGAISARGTAERSEEAVWDFDLQTAGSAGISGAFSGQFEEKTGIAALDFDALFARLERFAPQLQGAVAARGRVDRTADLTWTGDITTDGSAGISGAFSGRFEEDTGSAALNFDALFERLERFVPQLNGTVAAKGRAERTADQNWTAQLTTDGSAGIKGGFRGQFDETSGAASVFYDMALAELERLVPGLTGTLDAKGRARRSDTQEWQLNAVTAGDAGLSGTFKALFEEASGDATLYFDATLERIQRIVSDVSGSIVASGEAARQGNVWRIDTFLEGPGGISADIDGSFDQARNLADIEAKGAMNLALANPFLKPNSIRGGLQYDLVITGPPEIASVSGTITSSDGTFAIPSIAQSIVNLASNVTLANSSANITVTGGLRAGGGFRVSGPVGLAPPFAGNLAIDLLDLILTDNLVFTSSANGQIRVDGPLTGGAQIAGQINFGETEINISNASGAVGAAPIPDIRHVGEPAASRQTRSHAGLIKSSNSGGGGPAYGLDVTLNAPARIFARGRGLNAELGGNLVIRGDSNNVVPIGQISLIRGVFDILGRRLDLDEGSITMQGSLEPFLFFQASTSTSEGDATLTIAGPASAPRIEVTSVPERPSEEALALLLFGNQFEDLTPFQLAQLGAQVAALAGRGGGFLSSVREGLGVDNVDITADEDGRAALGIGTYLTDDVYTDVTVNAAGESELNLNLDLTDSLTAKGSVDNEGNTGIGLFFQRDY